MLPGKTYTLEQIVHILRHRWLLVVVPLAIGAAAGLLAYKWMPVRYRSETLIMVTPQRIPDSYVKSTVSTNVEDRLQSVREQILSRSRLERIILDLDLYKDRRKSGLMEDIVLTMAGDVDVKLQGNESSFRVSYIGDDPVVAQEVTRRLAALSIEENLRDRESLADNTSNFLESQLVAAKAELIEQEKKLEVYRREYAGQLPSQLQGNLQSVQNAQMQLQTLNESMNRARERRLLIERQIADGQSQPAEITPAGAGQSGTEAGSSLSAAQQLEGARARLEALKLRYTKDYPDVLAQEQTIRDLQVRADDEALRPAAATPERLRSPSEQARQKRLRDLRAELDIVDRQLATAQKEDDRLKQTMADYAGKIAVVPTRESELVELTRDYATLQATYASLLQKREDSKLAANLERRQSGEQFRIVDPASRPERPSNQKQQLAALIGGPLSGLVLGLFLVGFLEFRDPSFRSEDDVLRVLSLPVLALIPMMTSRDEAPARPKARPLDGSLTAGLVLLGPAAALAARTLQL